MEHFETQVVTKAQPIQKLKKPRLFKVLLHNDDYTTREFVVHVLKSIFHKTEAEAIETMLHVHQKGIGIAGIYTFEIAETKARVSEKLAKDHEFPLKLSLEPNEEEDSDFSEKN